MSNLQRVVIDARMVGPTGHGIGLYVLQLAEGLSRLELPYEPFYLVHSQCPAESLLRRLPHKETSIGFLERKEIFKLSAVIQALSPTLFHTPSFSSLFSCPFPYVQTVHDLNHLHFGSVSQKLYYRFLLLRSLKKARMVLSVSDCAAMEIRSWLLNHGIDRKVSVAPNAILPFPERDDEAVLRSLGLKSGDFFYALSNSKPHKNLAMLRRAYLAAGTNLPPLVLSVPGESCGGLIFTGPQTDDMVGALLRNAKAVFSPSLYEGFGRPPVEAAIEGTVPVVSSIAVHHEVLDGVSETVFLEPENEAQWSEQFRSMKDFKGRVSKTSKDWIRKRWSIEALAGNMNRFYKSCLEV